MAKDPTDLTHVLTKRQFRIIVEWLTAVPSSLFVTQDVERYFQINAITDGIPADRYLKTMYENPMSLGRLVVAAKLEKAAHGLDLVVVDLVDTIDPGGTFDSVDARTAAVIQMLQALAREVDVTVIATKTTGIPERIEGMVTAETALVRLLDPIVWQALFQVPLPKDQDKLSCQLPTTSLPTSCCVGGGLSQAGDN